MRGAENLQPDAEEVHGAGQQQTHHPAGHRTVAMRRHAAVGTRHDPRLPGQEPFSRPFALIRNEFGHIIGFSRIRSVNKFGVDRNRCRPKTENKSHSGDNHHFWFI